MLILALAVFPIEYFLYKLEIFNRMEWNGIYHFGPRAQRWDQQSHSARTENEKKEIRQSEKKVSNKIS